MAKILLLDGNSLAYRAFFALPSDMATASGQVTNAVYGFTSMLQFMLNEHRPDLLAVTFDRPEPSFRHEMVTDYKAGRAETPDILRQQMGLIRQVVTTLDLPMYELSGYEADDLLATLATQGRDRGDDIIIVTGDRDSYQLVEDPHIRVLYNKRGVSDYVLYDEAGIFERTGVSPAKYAEYASLRGDPSDNLPGVPGVGEKTAAKLINDYGNLDGVFANLAKCSPKLRDNLTAAEAQVRSNARAIPLMRDVPGISIELIRTPEPDLAAARDLFKSLEFRAMSDRVLDAFAVCFGGGTGPTAAAISESGEPIHVEIDRELRPEHIDGPIAVAALWAGVEGRSAVLGLAVTADGERVTWLEPPALVDFRPIGPVHGHRVKELLRALPVGATVGVDTAVAGYLLDPADQAYPLEELALRYAGLDVRVVDGPPPGQLDLTAVAVDPAAVAAHQAAAVWHLVKPLNDAMEARGLRALYDEIERPLIAVLAHMETVGVRVDVAYLRALADELTTEAAKAEAEIQAIAGEKFLVNSVPQLRSVLFDKLGLKTDKKTKTGYSTDAQALEKLRGTHPIIEPLLRYREVEKLRSTYGESLLAEVATDGRIHATFQQTVARTGRLSSDKPNLHNIPIRSEEGRRFRRAFIPAEGFKLLVADYNQIELRVIAHLAKDPGLIEAFTSGADIHNATASRVFHVEPGGVTIAMRSKAKMVSYGLAYGMESYGLAQRLGVPVAEAQEILDAYFVAFPNVRSFMDLAVAEARNKGYTETLFGRRRQIPELQSPNFRIRQMGERQAMNAGIQGLAADIFKVALVRLEQDLLDQRLTSRIILQVHDEIILEVPAPERDLVHGLTLSAMRGAAQLDVPLEVNVAWGRNWAEAK